jgi:hypothetical protein
MAAARLHDASEIAVVHSSYVDGFRAVALACAILASGSAAIAGLTLQKRAP